MSKKILFAFMVLVPLKLISATNMYLEKSDKHQIKLSQSIQTIKGNTNLFNNSLGFSSEITLDKRKTYSTQNGKTVSRYQQKFKGIPIIGGDIIIHEESTTRLKKVYGAALYGIKNDINTTKVTLNKNEALSIAKNIFSKSLTKKNHTLKSNAYSKETSVLKIWKSTKNIATLIYDVQFTYMNSIATMPRYYIDANTGAILKSFDNLMHVGATGPGGNQKTGQYVYGTDYGFLNVTQNATNCTLENLNVKTVDLNNTTNTVNTTAFSFLCPDNAYKAINGAYSPLNDAHYFGNITFDMYNTWLGIPPLTFQLILKVHYGVEYENAFWDGTSMTFGDGNTTFHPLVDIDVTSHEVAHGFTQQNSNLIYSGKSGGLNESFSDISGEAAEYYLRGQVDWFVGADIVKNGLGLRSMSNPISIPPSIDNQADYVAGIDVHHSSGVFNKAYYLLSTTNGWTPRTAFEVYAKANQLYWISDTDWNNAGAGLLNAATDLGYNLTEVCTSLNAVGVMPQVPSCPLAPPVQPIVQTILNINSAWTANSLDARHRTGSYAEYHTFTLTQTTEVTIDLNSSADTYMFLLDDTDNIIVQDDDGGAGLNSRIVNTLTPGTYTIEATTFSSATTGAFTLTASKLVNPTKNDFNSDGIPDILWRTDTDIIYMWLMNADGTKTLQTIGSTNASWTIKGIGDFNNDGISDILWKRDTNIMYMWLMNVDGTKTLLNVGSVPSTWAIKGISDFNNDGIPDILWRTDTDIIYMWLMNANGTKTLQTIGSTNASWTIKGIGDFNNDGISDILWRRDTNIMYMWLMNVDGTKTLVNVGSVPSTWAIKGISDFNNDGISDILWRTDTDIIYMWLMYADGTKTLQTIGSTNASWTIKGIGDFNNDGISDILWRRDTNIMYMWLMNVDGTKTLVNVGSVPSTWTIETF